jgi:hypothetical protein
VLLLAVACLAAWGAGRALRQGCHWETPAAWAVETEETATDTSGYPGPWAVAERSLVEGEERGAVRIGEQDVLEIQTAAGGLTGYERTLIVAKRLNDALAAGVRADQIRTTRVQGMTVLKAGEVVLVTVTPAEAERQKMTESQLADAWVASLRAALGGTPAVPPPTTTPTTTTTTTTTPSEGDEYDHSGWTPPEPYKDKIVPIVSVLEGVKIGVARVNGPTSKVDLVQAVAQLETDYKKVLSISLYVPISTEVPGSKLARVQGVGVTGLADIRIR